MYILFQSYAVRYGDHTDMLPFSVRVVVEQSKFWDILKEVVAMLRPLVDAQAKTESDQCTLGEVGVCFGELFIAFSAHSNFDERTILLEKLEKRWKTFYQPELMIVAMFSQPNIKLTKFQVEFPLLKNIVHIADSA